MTFQLGKISFELSFPLVALMTAVIIFDTSMSVIICFAGVIAHEAGHLLALRHFGSYPQKIKLTLFDIAIIDRKKTTLSDKAEIIITLAGVTVNFILAGYYNTCRRYCQFHSCGNFIFFYSKSLYGNIFQYKSHFGTFQQPAHRLP